MEFVSHSAYTLVAFIADPDVLKLLFAGIQLPTSLSLSWGHFQVMIAQSKLHVQEHWTFNDKLLGLQQWLTVTRQKLESYWDAGGGWKTNNRASDLEVTNISASVTHHW